MYPALLISLPLLPVIPHHSPLPLLTLPQHHFADSFFMSVPPSLLAAPGSLLPSLRHLVYEVRREEEGCAGGEAGVSKVLQRAVNTPSALVDSVRKLPFLCPC